MKFDMRSRSAIPVLAFNAGWLFPATTLAVEKAQTIDSVDVDALNAP